ncbi:hypothetical protein GX563_00275 [Candidatus Bathyarchaeota archaeon]|nr:hypothetical protein [Candidatus Bathyarchaeota archaeon]
MTAQYSMTPETQADYRLNENDDAIVTVRSKKPLQPRAVYVGEATMQFMWVHTGKTSNWTFTPSIPNPRTVQISQVMDGQDQVTTIELGKVTPASGMVDINGCGEFHAPAIHFDLPYATDLWVFILKAPSEPLKVTADKALLNIAHTLAYATAQVESSNDEESLRTYVTVHGEGFMNVILNLKRQTPYSKTEETITEFKYGAAAAIWRPTIRSFDVTLTTPSGMSHGDFLSFIKTLGADVQSGSIFSSLKNDFVLSDGPAMEYTLTLKGEKKYIGKEEASTAIKLLFASSQGS